MNGPSSVHKSPVQSRVLSYYGNGNENDNSDTGDKGDRTGADEDDDAGDGCRDGSGKGGGKTGESGSGQVSSDVMNDKFELDDSEKVDCTNCECR